MVNEIKVTYYKEVVQRFKVVIMNKFQQNRLFNEVSILGPDKRYKLH